MPKEKNIRQVPVLAMRGSVVFPHTDSFLSFGRTKSVSAINAAFQKNRVVAIFNQKDAKVANPEQDDLFEIGTIATITQIMSTEDEIHAMVRGQARIKLNKITQTTPYLIGEIEEITELGRKSAEVEAHAKKLSELFKSAVNLGKGVDVQTIMKVMSRQSDPVELVDSISSLLDISTKKKQELLETISVLKRIKKVVELLSHEVNVLDLEQTIADKTQKRFEDQMRKAMLREKKRTIEKELGEDDEEGGDDTKEYRKKIKDAQMPSEVRKKAVKELKRLKHMSPNNPESGYIRNYLDWLTDMPWAILSDTSVPVKKAARVLDEDHYALDKTKERILEFLAVMRLKDENDKKSKKKNGNGENQPTILCFIGPPGVGKTSIGKSIAKALGRKFVRISLGGIRDEAEMRGHRRTYVGAMPGRIIQSIKNAGTRNPVFMLDEIDKLGSDYRGDPSSALLEILDPEQNREFSDHYLEVPFDLSEVMFITTANVLDTIPLPLRDRMEMIKFPGYVENEKFHIAKKYLWPKQLRVNGLDSYKINITDKAIHEVIKYYTREAGVRNLERSLANLCRKIARLVAEKKKYPKTVGVKEVNKLLGSRKYRSQFAEKKDEVGMSTGLAVTSAGGEILFIEVALMPGKGKLTLTGQLGDVMQESAKAAFTWTKSHWKELGLREDFGKRIDVHIHVPEGATPKDGPSAGIAITTALVSALTKKSVKRYVGMTGEVTLRGRTLEIGGVKEKTIAGHRAGLKTIILPKDNKKDMDEVPAKVKKDINFKFADNVEEVLKVAITDWPPKKKANGKPKVAPPSYIASV